MEGGSHGAGVGQRPPVIARSLYCLVPPDLAPKLHALLLTHFGSDGDGAAEVVVEQRSRDRRAHCETETGRRVSPLPFAGAEDRRRVRNYSGRRVADRRAVLIPVSDVRLPGRARRYADQLVIAERIEQSFQHREDVDTAYLVIRIQAGDRDAFAILYTRYFERVYGYLRLMLRDEHEAEDATQQVFIQVMEGLHRYERRPGKSFRGWLFTVARNLALQTLRGSSRSQLLESSEIDQLRDEEPVGAAHVAALDWISDRELLLFIERLPIAQRQVLLLRFQLDFSTAEIAEALGRSTEDVRVLQHRALAFLRMRLDAVAGQSRGRGRMRSRAYIRQAPVLRARRFALISPR